MSPSQILVVDDEPAIRELLEITLSRMGHAATTAADLKQARGLLKTRDFDLCLTDLRLPDGSGITLVEYIQRYHPRLPVAVITAYGSMDTAISALKAGAFDFISKPVDLENLRALIEVGLRTSLVPTLNHRKERRHNRLLGQSQAMTEIRATVEKLARSQAPVCIRGESGTGKELIARQIHDLGPRRIGPFIPVNCGAIPAELMENEFFGHLKGSFTGAAADKPGLFQAANRGTLFLDEVADLPHPMQVKLLRALQERRIKPVGATIEHSIDVRILSATHQDLIAEVAAGRFRQDLYYRLNVIEIIAPPLRERIGDLALLAEHLLTAMRKRLPEPPPRLGEAALKMLAQYPFPGNVRELENILERAATLCTGQVIQPADLRLPHAPPTAAHLGGPGHDLDDTHPLDTQISAQQRKAIRHALEQTRWNKTAAARLLGLSFRQLRYRIKKLGID